MPKIGTFRYPAMGVSDALEIAKKMAGKVDGRPITPSRLASALGFKGPQDRRFDEAVMDLRQFAMVEISGESALLTGLVRRLADGGEAAVAEAAFNVPLYSSLANGFTPDKPPTEEDLGPALQILTGTTERQVKPHVQPILDRLLEIARLMGR
jgi:hypothetical protein